MELPTPPAIASSAGIVRARLRDQRRRGILARVPVVEAGLVGEDDQRVGLDQVGDHGRQRVVVAEADLVDGDGVVLVDDGDDAEPEQRAQRRARVEIALAVGEVLVGEQDLRGREVVLAEARFVGLDQAHLADGGRGLELVQRVRPLLPAEALHAFRDRAARDQHDLAPLRRSCAICPAQRASASQVQPLARGW